MLWIDKHLGTEEKQWTALFYIKKENKIIQQVIKGVCFLWTTDIRHETPDWHKKNPVVMTLFTKILKEKHLNGFNA